MDNHWSQQDVFPIIARGIETTCGQSAGFVTHDEIVTFLLNDSEAIGHIDTACEASEARHSREWMAHNMVAWFSQRITIGDSDWSDRFDREKINDKWAYKIKST